jgi:hypothetical protein
MNFDGAQTTQSARPRVASAWKGVDLRNFHGKNATSVRIALA